MTRATFYILILSAFVLQSCSTYKRSFGETYTSIDNNQNTETYRLDISSQGLKEVPETISGLTKLSMLNLSGNTQLPIAETLEKLPNPESLEVLILDSLLLKRLPKDLDRFVNLKHLSISQNPDIALEEAFLSLKELSIEFLNMQHNNLETVPESISKLTSLKSINLSYNHLIDPKAYTSLSTLPSLESLWLSHNYLSLVPEEIGGLTTLRNLYLEHNKLISLPDAMRDLKRVWVMHIGHNAFEKLPEQLVQMPSLLLLHINNCRIEEIPDVFATSKYPLVGIILDENKLSDSDKQKWKKEFSSFFLCSF